MSPWRRRPAQPDVPDEGHEGPSTDPLGTLFGRPEQDTSLASEAGPYGAAPEPLEPMQPLGPGEHAPVRRGVVAGRRGVSPRREAARARAGEAVHRAGRATVAAAAAGRVAAAGGVAAFRRLPTVMKVVAGVAVASIVAALVLFWPGPQRTEVTAYFTRAVGLYPGSEVRILGIPVGRVLAVEPEGESVRVDLEFDARYEVPADAQAVVIAGSVVSDRFVQLTPVFSDGPAMEDGDEIPVERTAVPVELDRVFSSLDELSVALGPEGANSDGALTRVLETGADNLDGQGENLGETVQNLSLAVDALATEDDDLFTTVKNLQTFTTTMAENDGQVRTLNGNLATVSDQLAGEREDLALALSNLAVALDEVSVFVEENRSVLTDDVAKLETVTASVASQKDALEETLVTGPVAISNLSNAYNPRAGTLDTRMNLQQTHDPIGVICGLLGGVTSAGSAPLGELGCEPGGALNPVATLVRDLLVGTPLGAAGSRVPAQSTGLVAPAAPAPDTSLAGILPGGDR